MMPMNSDARMGGGENIFAQRAGLQPQRPPQQLPPNMGPGQQMMRNPDLGNFGSRPLSLPMPAAPPAPGTPTLQPPNMAPPMPPQFQPRAATPGMMPMRFPAPPQQPFQPQPWQAQPWQGQQPPQQMPPQQNIFGQRAMAY